MEASHQPDPPEAPNPPELRAPTGGPPDAPGTAPVKLFVATLLLVAAAVAAKVAIEHLAPEGTASASDSIPRAKVAGTVDAVTFTGPGLRAAFLSEVVATRAGAPLSTADLAGDRIRIVDALVARGHLDAHAGEAVVAASDAGTFVDFPVTVGPTYVIRDVRVAGRAVAGIAAVPTVRPGDPAASTRIEASAALLRTWLADHQERGTVSWTLTPDPLTQQADVVFTVR